MYHVLGKGLELFIWNGHFIIFFIRFVFYAEKSSSLNGRAIKRGGGVKGPAINPFKAGGVGAKGEVRGGWEEGRTKGGLFTADFPNYLKFNRRPVINVVHSKQTICVD